MNKINGFFEVVSDAEREKYGILPATTILIPQRGTAYSAGYDFAAPKQMFLLPDMEYTIPTGLKVKMPSDYVLKIYPRSSYGCKYGFHMLNTTPVIDADYYNNPNNEGHILLMVAVRKPLTIEVGDKFCQGIFEKYFVLDGENVSTLARTGGFGSTGK